MAESFYCCLSRLNDFLFSFYWLLNEVFFCIFGIESRVVGWRTIVFYLFVKLVFSSERQKCFGVTMLINIIQVRLYHK